MTPPLHLVTPNGRPDSMRPALKAPPLSPRFVAQLTRLATTQPHACSTVERLVDNLLAEADKLC